MGWWSKTVLGGDGPCDILDIIYIDHLQCDPDWTFDQVQQAVISNLPLLASDTLVSGLTHIEDKWIVYQVIGTIILKYGIDPTNEFAKLILQQAKIGATEDDWSYGDDRRKFHMTSFIQEIDQYIGKPVIIS